MLRVLSMLLLGSALALSGCASKVDYGDAQARDIGARARRKRSGLEVQPARRLEPPARPAVLSQQKVFVAVIGRHPA